MVPRKPTAKAVTFRLTEEARALLAELARRQGIDRTAALELLIRQAAARAGIDRPSAASDDSSAPPLDKPYRIR